MWLPDGTAFQTREEQSLPDFHGGVSWHVPVRVRTPYG